MREDPANCTERLVRQFTKRVCDAITEANMASKDQGGEVRAAVVCGMLKVLSGNTGGCLGLVARYAKTADPDVRAVFDAEIREAREFLEITLAEIRDMKR